MGISKKALVNKWFLYAVALLPLCFLDGMVLGRIDFFGSRPFLFPLAVSLVAIWEGIPAGAGYGLYVGLFSSFLKHGLSGSFIFLFSLFGALVGLAFRHGIKQGFTDCLVGSGLALCSLSLLRMLYHAIIDGASFFSLFLISGPELLWSLLFFPLVYGIYRLVYRRVSKGAL
jgi:cell shape-determining protein MreD